ncbi:hypothetical protein [Clostridium ljungdahlii]|uniref:Uncharacterized protein n=1 Tax=Clostridium ljungdahlii TaxID=1538 RepID=A0A166REX0_9CLOT|nr:hypothetical protein [Clostridium ljungdahlii]OAA90754.1 hypothetical protein WY13_01058 [Clostridium ljungdahlii]
MILIATGINDFDEQIKEAIDREHIDDTKIIGYREYLIGDNVNSNIVILSKRLPGDIPEKQLIFELKKGDKAQKIIYLTNQEDIEGVAACFDFAVYDFLFDPVTVDDIVDCIKNQRTFTDVSPVYLNFQEKVALYPKEVLKKPIVNVKKEVKSYAKKPVKVKEKIKEVEKIKLVEKKVIETRLYKQNVVSFYSSDNNILASLILANSAAAFSKKSENRILVIDDNAVPCLDHLFGIGKEILVKDNFNTNSIDTGLSACYTSIENFTFTSELLKKFVIPVKHSKIDVLTGIYDESILKQMESKHYKGIIDTARKIYDVVLIAVNPFKAAAGTIFSLLNSDKIITVVESNYLSARSTINALKTFESTGIYKDKFGIVAAAANGALDIGVMEKIFEDYKIISQVPLNKNYNSSINAKKILINSLYCSKSDKKAYGKIVSFMGLSNSIVVKSQHQTGKENCKNNNGSHKKVFNIHLNLPFIEKLKNLK